MSEIKEDRARPTRTGHRSLAGLDGFRAIAVALVILHHSAEQFRVGSLARVIADNGVFGVPIFFVLSGYLITYLLLREESEFGRVDLPKFFARRVIRIVPPAYALIAVFAVMMGLGWIVVSPLCFASCLLFFRNYTSGPWITGHLWSLAVEEHFYLIWPVFFILVRGPKARIAITVAAVAICPFWRQYWQRSHGESGVNWFRTDLRYDAILIGCLFALLGRIPWADRRLGSKAMRSALFGLATSSLLLATFMPGFMEYRILRAGQLSIRFVCVALLINFSVRNPDGWFAQVLDWAPMALIGRLSYSIYLWQQLFCWQAWPDDRPSYLRWPLNLIPIAICASMSYLLVERPFFRLRASFRPR